MKRPRQPLRRKTPLESQRRKKSLRMLLLPEFKRLIRARDKVCQKGGDCGGHLEASHIYPVGSWPLLALYPLNCIGLCARHHRWTFWHKSPLEAWPWFRATYPQDWQDRLESMREQVMSRKGMTEADLRAEWAREGLTG